MSRPRSVPPRRIVLGVTSSLSLKLMRGYPEHLAERGWDVHVVASGNLPAPGPGVTYHQLAMRRDPHPWHDLRSLVAWVRLLRQLKPDVVSTGTPKAGMLGMVAAWLTRQPVRIYKLRGLRLETSTGPKRCILSLAERLSMACAQSIISVSPSLRQRAIELRLAPARKIVVLGAGSSNGVDVDRFDPSGARRDAARRRVALTGSAPVIGFVGRIDVDKGVQELLTAASLLQRSGHDFTLLLVGPIENDECDLQIDAHRRSGIPIERWGFLDDPVDVFHAIDILCLPTRREGFPNVVLEAAASAVPTVTTYATGAVDSVVPGKTGLLATVGDPISIAEALGRLLSDSDLRTAMGRQARDHVERHYRREDVWSNEDALYAAELQMRS